MSVLESKNKIVFYGINVENSTVRDAGNRTLRYGSAKTRSRLDTGSNAWGCIYSRSVANIYRGVQH